jgi:hypothetical protein
VGVVGIEFTTTMEENRIRHSISGAREEFGYRFGAPGPLRRFRSRSDEIRYLTSLPVDRPLQWRQRLAPAATLPLDRDERAAEAVQRLLPDLRKLNRYERRSRPNKMHCANLQDL